MTTAYHSGFAESCFLCVHTAKICVPLAGAAK